MAYRLRRVIGVNIRNPRDEGPSLRVAELDTRGAVIAAGRNGVGKTSFLRLIPLFYGATPTRILRGSGLTTMMRHMLPHPSSAVVFEYERESENDLRCVVMHCRPDEDAPQFHILRGGFQERFFYDGDLTFVLREDFKARVEKLGIPVEQKLTLSEYRAVILNEKSSSKNAAALRNLAAAHSLGPLGSTLQGLDQIAAAMGNEKISFRDLQDIVVERITSSISDEGGRQTVRQIKKGARDVTSWLNDLQHLRELKNRQSQADELAKACSSIQSLDMHLRELRAAVTGLLADAADNAQRLGREKTTAQQAALEQSQRIEDAINVAARTRDEAKKTHDSAAEVVRSTEERNSYFKRIRIEELVVEADEESTLLARQEQVDAKLSGLRKAAQGIQDSFAEKSLRLTEETAKESARLSMLRESAQEEESAALANIDAAEDDALSKLVRPKRLLALPEEIAAAQVQLGEAKGELKNPKAAAKTLKELEGAAQSLVKAREAERQAKKQEDDAAGNERASFLEQQRLQSVHEKADRACTELRAVVATAEADIKPPEGSLLEFLRQSRVDGIADVAKVLSPALVKQTHLEPVENLAATGTPDGLVAVGAFTLNVQRVESPGWFDLRDAKNRLDTLKAKQAQADEELHKAAQALERATSVHKSAGHAASLATDARSKCSAETQRLEQREKELKSQRDAEISAERNRLEAAVAKAQEKVISLQSEMARLESEYSRAAERLKGDFASQRATVRGVKAAAFARVKALQDELQGGEKRAREALQTERDRGLKAAGVDPQFVNSLQSELNTVQGRLRAIAANRHEVVSWKEFSTGPLSRLELDREHAKQAREELTYARGQVEAAEQARETHKRESAQELERFDAAIRASEQDSRTLNELLEQQLSAIGEPSAGHVLRSWTIQEIAGEVVRKRRELIQSAAQADNLYSTLRGLMRRYEGQVNDWLGQAEAALPNFEGWPDHMAKRHRGLMLCDWFQRDYVAAVNSLHQDLGGILSLAATFVRDIDMFERQVSSFNHGLQKALRSVTGFDNFRDLQVEVRSSANKLEYIKTLQQMQQMNDSRVSFFRGSSAGLAREMELPTEDVEPVIRSFRDFLAREGGISVNLADQIRLECSLTINKSRVVISNEEEFKARASNGNSALIVAMFLMGFAQMVRKDSPVRITWVTDEIGRFDSGNVAAFLETLDTNHIDVISAAPQADPSMLYLFNQHCIFRKDGSIWKEREQSEEQSHAH